MISRVIEAKPEELRVFLEEAAGISKYKERRRETENRLEDTRENLARVDDIRRELDAQIEKLAHQAEIARQYKELAAEATLKQQIALADAQAGRRRRDAETSRARSSARPPNSSPRPRGCARSRSTSRRCARITTSPATR